MSNSSRADFCYLSNDAICILRTVDRKIILPCVITLPHFPLSLSLPTTIPHTHASSSENILFNVGRMGCRV